MFNKFILGVIIVILFSCSNSTEPDPDEFSKMEIHYTRSLGLSGGADRLYIFGDGTIQKLEWTGKVSQGILTTTQKDSLIQLFSNFSQYDPSYSGSVADADAYTIVYIYEGKSETVRVYAPGHVYIPESLWEIIKYLRALRSQVIFQ